MIRTFGWGYLLSSLLALGAQSSTVITESIPVDVVYVLRAGGENEYRATLYTQTDPAGQGIPKKGIRLRPLVKISNEKYFEIDSLDSGLFAVAVDRLHQNGVTLVEMEDGTWAQGTSEGIKVRVETNRTGLYFAVRIFEIVKGQSGRGHEQVRTMNIPLVDVSDRVFSAPAKLSVPRSLEEQNFFLTNDDETLYPVVIVGFQRDFAWVVGATEMRDSQLPFQRLYRVRRELLRRLPAIALMSRGFKFDSGSKRAAWLEPFYWGNIAAAMNPGDRLAFLQGEFSRRHPFGSGSTDLSVKYCATSIIAP